MSHNSSDHQLETALRSLSQKGSIPSGLKSHLKTNILSQLSDSPTHTLNWGHRSLSWAPALASVILLFGSGTAVLANSAKPGDILYPIDRLTESISQKLVKDESAKAKLYASLSDERIQELKAIESVDSEQMPPQKLGSWLKAKAQAESETAKSTERLSQVEATIGEKYETSTNPAQKESLLKLRKHLLQVIDRHDQDLKGEDEPDEDKDNNARGSRSNWEINQDLKNRIRTEIRREFKMEARLHLNADKPEPATLEAMEDDNDSSRGGSSEEGDVWGNLLRR